MKKIDPLFMFRGFMRKFLMKPKTRKGRIGIVDGDDGVNRFKPKRAKRKLENIHRRQKHLNRKFA